MQSILASVGEGIILYDRDLRYRFWNPAMERLTGLGADQVLGRRAPEVFPYLQKYGIDELLIRALSGETIHGQDIPYVVPETGRQGWQSGIYRPHQDATGAIIGVVGLIRDITERKATEESLRQYRLLADTTRDIILFIRLTDGRILQANQAALDAYGYTAAEVRDRTIDELRAPDTRDAIPAQIQTAFAEGLRFETVHQRKDGSRFPVEVSSRGTTLDGEPVLLSIIRDISERKRAAAEWEQTFDAVPDAVAILDAQHRIVRVNRAMATRLGLAPERCVGRLCFEAVHGCAEPPTACPHTQTCRDGKEHAAEVHEPRLGGDFLVTTTPLFNAQGALVGAVHIARDITARKQREEALRQSQQDLNRAQAVAHTGSWRLDVRLNELRWSDEAYRIFGIPAGTALSYETFLAAVHPEDRAEVDRRWQAALRGAPYDLEHRILVAGQVRWVRQRAEQDWDDQGALLGGFGTVQDITERKAAEEAQRRLTLYPEQNRAPVLRIARDGTLLYANPASRRLLEAWECTVGAPLSPAAQAILGAPLTAPEATEVEAGCGELTYALVCVPFAAEGYVNVYGADVTARKRVEAQLRATLAEKEAALQDNAALLQEVHHRTKNTLQMLCDMLFLQGETIESAEGKGILEAAAQRIFAFARLHEQLYRSLERGRVQLCEYLQGVIAGFRQLHSDVSLTVDVPLQGMHLDLERTIHCGLLVNELLTNALKHAFPPGAPGEIGVRLRTMNTTVIIEVWDRGKGLPPDLDPARTTSLGLRLVHILSRRLGATVAVEHDNGTCFRIRFPLEAHPLVEPRPA
jgi:PAS domain S-box-containing protein